MASDAFAWHDATSGSYGEWLPFVAVLLSALLVQSDSPSVQRAYWRTTPLSWTSVLTAKLMLIVFCVFAPLAAGQVIALIAHHVRIAFIPDLLIGSSARLSWWALTGLVIGTVTSDFKTLVVCSIFAGVISSATASTASVTTSPLLKIILNNRWPITAAIAVSVVAGVLAWFRRPRGGTRFATGIALCFYVTCSYCLGFLHSFSPSNDLPATSLNSVPVWMIIDSAHVVSSPGEHARYSIVLRLHFAGDTALHVFTQNTTLTVTTPGGHPTTIATHTDFSTPNFNFPALSANEHWLTAHESRFGSFDATFDVSESAMPFDSATVPGSTVAIDTRGYISAPQTINGISLEDGATFGGEGLSLRVRKMPRDSSFQWHLTGKRVDIPSPLPDSPQFWSETMLLKNSARGEVLPIWGSFGSFNNGSLILPHPFIHNVEARLELPTQFINAQMKPDEFKYIDGTPTDEQWFRDARLTIVRWIPQSNYQIHATYTVPR